MSLFSALLLTNHPVDREDHPESEDVPRHQPELVPGLPVLAAAQVVLLAPDVAVTIGQTSRSVLF